MNINVLIYPNINRSPIILSTSHTHSIRFRTRHTCKLANRRYHTRRYADNNSTMKLMWNKKCNATNETNKIHGLFIWDRPIALHYHITHCINWHVYTFGITRIRLHLIEYIYSMFFLTLTYLEDIYINDRNPKRCSLLMDYRPVTLYIWRMNAFCSYAATYVHTDHETVGSYRIYTTTYRRETHQPGRRRQVNKISITHPPAFHKRPHDGQDVK